MNTELEKQLETLIGKIDNKEDFEKVREQLLKRGVESLLKAEMTAQKKLMGAAQRRTGPDQQKVKG